MRALPSPIDIQSHQHSRESGSPDHGAHIELRVAHQCAKSNPDYEKHDGEKDKLAQRLGPETTRRRVSAQARQVRLLLSPGHPPTPGASRLAAVSPSPA